MTGGVAYNEIEPYAVEWMRWLMVQGLIAPGHIFTCSIEDLTPRDLAPFDQFHAFAGMGVWSYALRSAGWPDDRPIWTGSCPCQPFSSAGKGAGFADERHLWPAFFHLITTCRPQRVLGEQVSDKGGPAWIDLVSSDMEAAGYAFRAVGLCSAGFGSPDIRHRNYWLADAAGSRRTVSSIEWSRARRSYSTDGATRASGGACGMADPSGAGTGRDTRTIPGAQGPCAPGGEISWREHHGDVYGGAISRMADANHAKRRSDVAGRHERNRHNTGWSQDAGDAQERGPVNGFYADARWIYGRDERWRPIEPGTFPLANGVAARMAKLRAIGNAINAQVATEFIRAIMDLDNA